MDPLIGALIAGAIAWLSILLVVLVPGVPVDVVALRRVGGLTVAVLALQVLGVPLPPSAPLLVLLGGVIAVVRPRGAAAA